MKRRLLITGSKGLIGTALKDVMLTLNWELIDFDLNSQENLQKDTRNLCDLSKLVSECDGVVHLAAISRVIHGEKFPTDCMATNVGGTANVLKAISDSRSKPWIIFGSSREVYGQSTILPVTEEAQLAPVNVYGKSKIMGEELVNSARKNAKLRTCIVRFSNVYGSTDDHEDRVVPAFCRAAAFGNQIRVDGLINTFDFTHIDDVSRGISLLVQKMDALDTSHQDIHFVSGIGTTLGELASLATKLARKEVSVVEATSRTFDVSSFVGDPKRAEKVLGWRHETTLMEGMKKLIAQFAAER